MRHGKVMAAECAVCGRPMGDLAATHCSEECLLYGIRGSRSYHDDSGIEELVTRMKRQGSPDAKM